MLTPWRWWPSASAAKHRTHDCSIRRIRSAAKPDLLLMDEPFVSLDAPTAQRLRQLLLRIWQARPTTVLFVTHDLDEAIALADRILVLSDIPATVVADMPVTIPREKRMDAAVIDEFRRRLPESKTICPSDS